MCPGTVRSPIATIQNPGVPVIKFWRRLSWGYVEFGRGIDIDQDGGTDGTGILLRVEFPRWLVRFVQRRLPPKTEAEMGMFRHDISDVILASLIATPNLLGSLTIAEDFKEPTLTWTEDE
jgi:hypothetical protein